MEPISGQKQGRLPIKRGEYLNIMVDGQPVDAFAGETVAAVLLVMGQRVIRKTEKKGTPSRIVLWYGCVL